MSLSIGIVGLPNVGKSTLFKSLTKKEIEIANYPFATINPNVGVVHVPDTRLDALARFSSSERILPTTIEFVDIAGLVKGASKGEGLGNQFLSTIREVDAIAHVVRCFEDSTITHVEQRIDPASDIETIDTELILADLETITKIHARAEKDAKDNTKTHTVRLRAVTALKTALEEGKRAQTVTLDNEERSSINDIQLLTQKSTMFVGNISEHDATLTENELEKKWPLPQPHIYISMKIEAELVELEPHEAKTMMEELHMKQAGLDALITGCYTLLNLITFITTGVKETRAWTIRRGACAPEAAGKIHSDFERGFIAAEVIPWDELLQYSSIVEAREHGKIRTEGKEYVMDDGDVVEFKYSV